MATKKSGVPAILGGDPAVTMDHFPANQWPRLTKEDEAAVVQVMRDGGISTHPVVQELENDYAAFTGRPYAVAHNNGTSALLAAFHAIGLKPGDEVLVPSATFWASVLPMVWLGALPIFCESETDRLGIDSLDMEKRITERTRAIVIVHLWGLPSKMTKIFELAKKYNLKIIEDASHAHGAYWRGKPCGSLGDISVFSLQGDKLAPGGEGGIFLCDDYAYYEKAICLGDIKRIIELDSPARRFAATSFGIKTRISPISAAIAKNQLQRLNENNKQRNENLTYLSRALEKMGFHTFLAPPHIRRVYFEYIIRHNQKKNEMPTSVLVRALLEEGCRISAPRYPLLHQQPFFTEGHFKDVARLDAKIQLPIYKPEALPRTRMANAALLKLPSFPNGDCCILDQYIQAFEKIMAHSNEIIAVCKSSD